MLTGWIFKMKSEEIKNIIVNTNTNYINISKTTEFIEKAKSEKLWLCPIENKLSLLKNKNDEAVLKRVIENIKNDQYVFDSQDIEDLEKFISKIDKIVSIANRLNNFTMSKIDLTTFFNKIKNSESLQKKDYDFSNAEYLKAFLPHIYSVIKHCQNPITYPIYYKFWKNIIREVLNKKDDYTSMCEIYNTLKIEESINKHVYFGAYFSVIADSLAKKIKSKKIIQHKDDRRYIWLEKHLFNIGSYMEKVMDNHISNDNKSFNQDNKIIYQPLNQILYGPPGTGKTYNTINKALEIIFNQDITCDRLPEDKDKKFKINKKNDKCKTEEIEISYSEAFENDDREALKQIFDYYIEQGQIEFVTFHQSYGYEEFVEGIKARTNDDDNKQVEYSVEPGIFKKLCEKALTSYGNPFSILTDNLQIPLLAENHKQITILNQNENNIYINNPSGNSHTMNKKNILEFLEKKDFKPTKHKSYEPATAKYLFDNLTDDNNPKNYILIIDEINRGNISKIFGELITLIEPSKRIGEDEEIKLTLPNSPDEKFGVPSNLYIIGTMNTADRSIAQIDTALRRRFEFIEMMPNTDLFTKNKKHIKYDNKYTKRDSDLIVQDEGKEINIRLMLMAINERIEYILDREHTIGHSYFMPLIKTPTITKLDEIFRVNIIPLLAEYFYGDWGDIIKVLNDEKGNFIKEKMLTYTKNIQRENEVYEIVGKGFSICGYKNIYEEDCKDTNQEVITQNNEQQNK